MTPEKVELVSGRLYASQHERLTMLALLLENVGADAAVGLGDPSVWQAAIADLDRRSESAPGHATFAPALPEEERGRCEATLLSNLRAHHDELRALFEASSDHWRFEDPVYRFYHQSFKVYAVQHSTVAIVRRLDDLVPDRPLHPWFLEVFRNGTGRQFDASDNSRWTDVARPILEAFFHARYFLEMAVRYGALTAPPRPLLSGYAALLHLYQLR